MKSIETIVRDPATVARGLDILDGMVLKMESGRRIEISDAFAILRFLEAFLERHEHSEERAAKACIEDALRAKAGKDFVRNARNLSQLLRTHLSREDSAQPQAYPGFAYLERKYLPEVRSRVERYR